MVIAADFIVQTQYIRASAHDRYRQPIEIVW
jgi:hypothetical protein